MFFCFTFFFVACFVSITNPPCEGDQFWKTNRSIFYRNYCKFQEIYSVIMFHSSIGLCVLVFVCAGGGPRECICVRVVIVVCLRIGLGNETKARWFLTLVFQLIFVTILTPKCRWCFHFKVDGVCVYAARLVAQKVCFIFNSNYDAKGEL